MSYAKLPIYRKIILTAFNVHKDTAMCFICTSSWSLCSGRKLTDSPLCMKTCNQKGKEPGYIVHVSASLFWSPLLATAHFQNGLDPVLTCSSVFSSSSSLESRQGGFVDKTMLLISISFISMHTALQPQPPPWSQAAFSFLALLKICFPLQTFSYPLANSQSIKW